MTETLTFRGAGGIRLAADAVGDDGAPPAVLLHGGGQTRHAWGTTASVLAEHGWRAYTVDLRGHGESDWAPDGDYRLDSFAADIVEVAHALTGPPVLIGASLGGISSLTAIGESDAPTSIARALVLVDVGPKIEQAGVTRIGDFMNAHLDGFADLDEVADAVAAYNPHRPRPTDLSGLRKNVRQHDDGRWYWHWDPAFVNGNLGSSDETRIRETSIRDETRLEKAARSLTIPTLCVRGRVSDLLSAEAAQALLELVPHARLVDVAGAGHMVAGDRNDLFNDAVVTFLDELRTA
jgi:pimeloyl-ACP methyl ester carboxylesterase